MAQPGTAPTPAPAAQPPQSLADITRRYAPQATPGPSVFPGVMGTLNPAGATATPEQQLTQQGFKGWPGGKPPATGSEAKKRQQDMAEHDAWFRQQVQKGIESANAGDLISANEVEAEAADWRAETRRKIANARS